MNWTSISSSCERVNYAARRWGPQSERESCDSGGRQTRWMVAGRVPGGGSWGWEEATAEGRNCLTPSRFPVSSRPHGAITDGTVALRGKEIKSAHWCSSEILCNVRRGVKEICHHPNMDFLMINNQIHSKKRWVVAFQWLKILIHTDQIFQKPHFLSLHTKLNDVWV